MLHLPRRHALPEQQHCTHLVQGHTLLLENMGETVDAVLMPVITRATYKKVRLRQLNRREWSGLLPAGSWAVAVLQFSAAVLEPRAPMPLGHLCWTTLPATPPGPQGRSLYLKLGDTEVEYNKDFRLVLHSKSSNPHLGPELQVGCCGQGPGRL